MKSSRKKSTKKNREEISFGLVPEETAHHFAVTIGDPAGPYIYVSEHFEYFDAEERRRIQYSIKPEDPAMRVVLARQKWDMIKDVLQMEFNQRLKRSGLKTSQFKKGFNVLPRLFGKELVLLCWAVEDADPGSIALAVQNWQGLKPEERWWLYTMTNAATGQAIRGRDKGWRKAVRIALTENPVS
ncbi:MAG: DUF3780 domain-containing protein [Spirochaetia bacterium]|nr:DUF3780 domain-containing protein [Spirochaetia bacterium]